MEWAGAVEEVALARAQVPGWALVSAQTLRAAGVAGSLDYCRLPTTEFEWDLPPRSSSSGQPPKVKQVRNEQVKPSQTPAHPAFVWAATWARSQELLYLASWVVQQALGVVAKVLFIGDWLACPSVWHWAPAHHFFDRQAIPALSPRFYANHP